MAKQTINKLKSWFITLAKPTQQQFWDWMDSFWHKNESIPINSIDGLTDIVNNTASATVLNSVSEELNTHLADKNNPHKVTKAQLGLENVDNTSDTDKPLSNAARQAIADIGDILDEHLEDTENPHNVTALQLGLDKVNNTADADKPISTATQTALNNKLSQGGDALGKAVEIGSKDAQPVVTKINGVEKWRIDTDGMPISQGFKGVGNRLMLADSTGKQYCIAPVVTGENVITQTPAGMQNTATIVSPIANSSTQYLLSNSTAWSGGILNYNGIQGTYGYDTNYRYDCIETNVWKRTAINEIKLNIMLADVDDSTGDKTSVDLNSLFPSASIRQEVRGINNLYIKVTSITWEKYKKTIA